MKRKTDLEIRAGNNPPCWCGHNPRGTVHRDDCIRARTCQGIKLTRDPARKPHRVTRTLVMREGEEAPRNLYAWFDHFNREHFGGKLETPSLWIAPTSSPRATGEYLARDISGMQSVIRIRPSTYKRGDRHAIATLLHEMVHAYQHEVLADHEAGYKGHGPKFVAEANRIGVVLGFAECASKGRGGKARAETWPDLPPDPGDVASAPAEPSATEADEGELADPDVYDDVDELQGIARAAVKLERDRVTAFLAAHGLVFLKLSESTTRPIAGDHTPEERRAMAKLCKWLAWEIERGAHEKMDDHE
jgi:hypothetical protein